MNNLLSSEEVKRYLELEEKDLEGLIEAGRLNAYKIGGTFLRFRKDEVLTLKQEFQQDKNLKLRTPWLARLGEFWRFNNFYILSILFIALLFFVVVRT